MPKSMQRLGEAYEEELCGCDEEIITLKTRIATLETQMRRVQFEAKVAEVICQS